MWLGIQTKVFNVGNYRRKLHGAHQLHDFFDPANPEGERSRREAAVEALNDMIYWFKKEQGVVALYDATNSTRSRRDMLLAACKKHDIQVMFIEVKPCPPTIKEYGERDVVIFGELCGENRQLGFFSLLSISHGHCAYTTLARSYSYFFIFSCNLN